MPADLDVIGKTYPPDTYAAGREKIREYAFATGETSPLCLDVEAARAAGHADVVAPPMFAVVFGARALMPAIFDPEVGIDFSRVVHGGQDFTWGAPVIAGDEIETTVTLRDVSERAGNRFFVHETRSVNQDGAEVCLGVWTNIVRGA